MYGTTPLTVIVSLGPKMRSPSAKNTSVSSSTPPVSPVPCACAGRSSKRVPAAATSAAMTVESAIGPTPHAARCR